MTIAFGNRVETNAFESTPPQLFFSCNRCGYRNLKASDSFCSYCGTKIDKFYVRIKEIR